MLYVLELGKSTDSSFSVGLVDDNDIYKWSVCFTGPEDTIYEVKNEKAFLKTRKKILILIFF